MAGEAPNPLGRLVGLFPWHTVLIGFDEATYDTTFAR